MAESHRIPTDKRFKNLTGLTFGKWTVIEYRGKRKEAAYWLCRCSCGQDIERSGSSLIQGKSTQCRQCANRNGLRSKHRMTKTHTYNSWLSMRGRCRISNHPGYHKYGARGIAVCDRWYDSFEKFLEDMGPSPSPIHTIDRYPNNSGNYEPGNCRWATPAEQARNRRSTHFITHDGITLCLKDWADRIGISQKTLTTRLSNGWSESLALTTPKITSRHHWRAATGQSRRPPK